MNTYPDHPTFMRAAVLAKSAESEATTYRGLLRFAVKLHRRLIPKAVYGWMIMAGTIRDFNGRYRRGADFEKLKAAMKARKADPEAKRARDDKAFRRKYMARLRKLEKEILCEDTIDQVTARAEDGVQRMREVYRLRSIVTGKPAPAVDKLPPSTAPTVDFNERDARKAGADLNMRGKDAHLYRTRKHSFGVHENASTDWSRGSNKPRHVRATHDNYVRSFAVISKDRHRIAYILHTTRASVTLPAGYIWENDPGLRACVEGRPDIDYHPSAECLLRPDSAQHIVRSIESNRATRERMKAQETAERAAIQGVYVCLADALRAGNCKAGCLSFAERHHIDPRRHYPALELLAIANGDAARVRLAITAARLRHEREMEQGYAVLAEHQAA